jgi:hypothetical protein
MKASFTLIPTESRRLIARAVAEMEEIKIAQQKAYIVITGGTTNGYIAQELAGADIKLEEFTAGTVSHRLMCVTDLPPKRKLPFPIILYKGKRVDRTIPEVFKDFHVETVLIKGANCIDSKGNVGVVSAGFDGGTVGATIGTVVSQGLKYIVAVGLEKLVPSVDQAASAAGAKSIDYSMGADFGIFKLPNAVVVTEIEALQILAGVKATHIGSGGIGSAAGAVSLIVQGEKGNVKTAIGIVESIKGEPVLPGFKGTCETCPYACIFAGKKVRDLPAWLTD